jgi:Domain of unknown function (DUF4440)
MKRCPTCNKTFTDQNLSYCIDDGTPLVAVPEDDELTEVRPGDQRGWAPPPYQPPSYVAPEKAAKRKIWPWVVGIGSLLALVLIGLSVAAVMLIPRMIKRAEPVVVSNSNSKNDENRNAPQEENSNRENENSVTPNTNSNSTINTPPPTDKEVVLAQLKDLENEWTVANINADKKKLGQILADDYVGPNAQGRMQGKAEYINTIERDNSIQKWEFEDLRLTLRGERATLIGKVRFQVRNEELPFDFVDSFVWRDNRWQATGSEVTPIK